MSEENDGSGQRGKGKNYAVGYGKPPKEYQWPPDVSGNPIGRPPGAKSFDAEVKRLLKRKIPIKVNGKVRKATVVEASFERLLHKAMAGDTKAMLLIIELARQFLPEDFKSFEALRDEDREILKRFVERKGEQGGEGADGNA